MHTSSEATIDYDGLMQANLARAFDERDASRRISAIAQIYADDARIEGGRIQTLHVLLDPPGA